MNKNTSLSTRFALTSTVVIGLLVSLILPNLASAQATKFVDYSTSELDPGGNITCAIPDFLDGYDFESVAQLSPNAGSYALPEGGTFSWIINDDVLSWEVTGAVVYAVLLKGGPVARAYDYTPAGATSDSGLTAPINTSNPNNKPYGISNIGFCYRPGLVVSKTAFPEWTRTWTWGIEKSADPAGPVFLASGEVATVTYDVVVSATSSLKFSVSGMITITNPTGVAASITSVTDIMTDDIAAVVDCALGDFPIALAAGASTTCSYFAELPNADSRVNTVVVESTGVMGGTATADVVFDTTEPTHEIDECIEVTDSNANGPQNEEVCATALDSDWSKTFTYQVSFGKAADVDEELVCGEQTYTNTASFITNNTDTTGSDYVDIDMIVDCPVLFCALSQGYWFAKPRVTWDIDIVLGNNSYNRADGLNIWGITGRNGSHEAKRAFTQYAAIMLSLQALELSDSALPEELKPYLETIEKYFVDNNKKLTSSSIGSFSRSRAVVQAAGFIGDWISVHHCN
jgi:hypothetical protein